MQIGEKLVKRNRSKMTRTMDFNTTIKSRLKELNKNMNIFWEQMENINKVKIILKEHMEILELKHKI